MLAYLFWHEPAVTVTPSVYEQELERFHHSLAHRPPSGFRGSASFRVAEPPWLGERPGAGAAETPSHPAHSYEDWYVVEDWSALGVLEEAAVASGHVSAHDAVASHAAGGSGGVYRLLEGSASPELGELAIWVSATPAQERRSLEALLADGIEPSCGGLWRRCLALGVSPEYCVLADERPAGVAAGRLPAGWSAHAAGRELVGNG